MGRPLFVILVVLLAATSAWFWRALERERAQGDQPTSESVRPAPTPVRETALPHRIEPLPPDAAAHPEGDFFGQNRLKNQLIFSGQDPRLLANQDYLEARSRYLAAAFEDRYPDLLRVLRIPKETALHLVELSYEEQMRRSAIPIGGAEDQRDFWLEQQQKAHESDRAMAALVGEAKLQAWKDYQASIWERHQVRRLRMDLMDYPDPLAGDEAEALIQALYEGRKGIEQDWQARSGSTGAEPGGPTFRDAEASAEFEAESERRSLEVAEKRLTSSQFEAYRAMIERQRTAQSAMEEMHRSGMEALE